MSPRQLCIGGRGLGCVKNKFLLRYCPRPACQGTMQKYRQRCPATKQPRAPHRRSDRHWQTDRQTERENRETDRPTDRWTARLTDGQTDRPLLHLLGLLPRRRMPSNILQRALCTLTVSPCAWAIAHQIKTHLLSEGPSMICNRHVADCSSHAICCSRLCSSCSSH